MAKPKTIPEEATIYCLTLQKNENPILEEAAFNEIEPKAQDDLQFLYGFNGKESQNLSDGDKDKLASSLDEFLEAFEVKGRKIREGSVIDYLFNKQKRKGIMLCAVAALSGKDASPQPSFFIPEDGKGLFTQNALANTALLNYLDLEENKKRIDELPSDGSIMIEGKKRSVRVMKKTEFYDERKREPNSTLNSHKLSCLDPDEELYVVFDYRKSGSAFAAVPFAQYCLNEFGEGDDKIVVVYFIQDGERDSSVGEQELLDEEREDSISSEEDHEAPLLSEVEERIYKKLKNSKNIILHGAPGTGKSYMTNRIACFLASDGKFTSEEDAPDDPFKDQIEFVQFHPSYDYTDFVEGLRPKINEEGANRESDDRSGDLDFELRPGTFKAFVERAIDHPEKDYVFIIDEINRGEISKIFGELFFSIDPDYRGPKGRVKTQYANMHEADEGDFYIPENVYIIGTMNDIDRSVDSIDFAMRRRFRFIEVNPDLDVLDELGEYDAEPTKGVMLSLNEEISKDPALGPAYQVGPSYFLKLKQVDDYDELWNEFIGPLLYEYIRGSYDVGAKLRRLASAYVQGQPWAGAVSDEEVNEKIDELWGNQYWSAASE